MESTKQIWFFRFNFFRFCREKQTAGRKSGQKSKRKLVGHMRDRRDETEGAFLFLYKT